MSEGRFLSTFCRQDYQVTYIVEIARYVREYFQFFQYQTCIWIINYGTRRTDK